MMNSKIKGLVCLCCVCALTACHSPTQVVAKESTSIPPVKTTSKDRLVSGESYYPVPATAKDVSNVPEPSLIPPGSDFQKYQKKSQVDKVEAAPSAQAARLVVSQSQAQVWARLGTVLAGSHYSVLDHDQSIHSYYILDSQSTGNKITKDTPIYRISVKKDGSNTSEIQVLNRDNSHPGSDVAMRILGDLKKNYPQLKAKTNA